MNQQQHKEKVRMIQETDKIEDTNDYEWDNFKIVETIDFNSQ